MECFVDWITVTNGHVFKMNSVGTNSNDRSELSEPTEKEKEVGVTSVRGRKSGIGKTVYDLLTSGKTIKEVSSIIGRNESGVYWLGYGYAYRRHLPYDVSYVERRSRTLYRERNNKK